MNKIMNEAAQPILGQQPPLLGSSQHILMRYVQQKPMNFEQALVSMIPYDDET